mgnify:CR=1 FL=1|jgi:hypothetical protein
MNPFAVATQQPQQSGALAQTDQHRAIAEVQAAMMIAKANPRDPVAAMDRILNSCTRPTLANAAVYQYSRGGSDVTGPSIRLAEAMAQQWGNMQFGIREVEQRRTGTGSESTVQAYAWDVETNTRREVTFTVPHERHTKQGKKALTDPRDVYELVANQGSRRLRACILAVIPGDVTEAAVAQCDVTMHATADTSPEAIKKLVEAFAVYRVNQQQLEKRIQRRMDAIQPAQVVALRKVYASLRDGMSKPEDWFEDVMSDDQAAVAEKAAEKFKARTQQAKPAASTAPPPPTAKTFEEVMAVLCQATTEDALYVAGDWVNDISDSDQVQLLNDKLDERLAEMRGAP